MNKEATVPLSSYIPRHADSQDERLPRNKNNIQSIGVVAVGVSNYFSGHGTYLCSSCLTGIGRTSRAKINSTSPHESKERNFNVRLLSDEPDPYFSFSGHFHIREYHPAETFAPRTFPTNCREPDQGQRTSSRGVRVVRDIEQDQCLKPNPPE